MPAACPTLSASSGVITPLARPRMPSVPKYLRTILGCPAAPPPEADTSLFSRTEAVKRCSNLTALANVPFRIIRESALASTVCRLAGRVRVPRPASGLRLVLVARARRRLRHRDRVGAGKAVLETAVERIVERFFALGLALLAVFAVLLVFAMLAAGRMR